MIEMHSLYVYQVVSTVSRRLSISTYVYVHLTINVGLEFLSSTGLLLLSLIILVFKLSQIWPVGASLEAAYFQILWQAPIIFWALPHSLG